MEIRNSLDAVRSLLGVNGATSSNQVSKGSTGSASGGAGGLGADQATLSMAGSGVSLAASDDEVRTAKVATIQAAIAAGRYHVPASAVATRVVDSMLGNGS